MMVASVRDILSDPAAAALLRFHALRGVPPEPARWSDVESLLWETVGFAAPVNFPIAQFAGLISLTNVVGLPLPLVPGRIVQGLAVRWIGANPALWIAYQIFDPIAVPDGYPGIICQINLTVNGYEHH